MPNIEENDIDNCLIKSLKIFYDKFAEDDVSFANESIENWLLRLCEEECDCE